MNNSDTKQAEQFNETGVMPRFFCKKCNTHIGCSYKNFGNMCDEEMNFEANKDKLIIYETIEEINRNKNI